MYFIVKIQGLFILLVLMLFSSACKEKENTQIDENRNFVRHNRKDMVLAAGGDLICARDLDKEIVKYGSTYPFDKAREHLKKVDIAFANLECVIAEKAALRSKDPKKINYNASVTVFGSIENSGFNVFSIANNHIFDLGAEGVKEFRNMLNKTPLFYGGAGKDIAEASEPVIVQVNGLKIAFLFYNSTGFNFCAKKKKAGYNCMPFHKKEKALKILAGDLKKVRNADLVFMSIHWGANYKTEPTEEQIEFAHAAIDNGVDAILGHSSHIFHGVEIYKNKPILYDMGDVFLKKKDGWDARSFFYHINVEDGKITSLELFPIFINDSQLRLADGMMARDIISRFSDLSKRFSTKYRVVGNKVVINIVPKKNNLKINRKIHIPKVEKIN